MKNKHLLTFCIFLALTSSGVLLTDVSLSIAQSSNSKPSNTVTKDPQKTSNKPEKESTGSVPKTVEPSSVDTDKAKTNSEIMPKDTKGDSTSSGNAVEGANKTDDDTSLLPWILGGLSGLLHLLEIAGLVWAYLKIQQLTEKSRDSRSQIKSLTERLSSSEQKQKTQGDQLKSIGSEAANARNLTARMNAIEQASAQQRHIGDAGYASPGYNLPSPETAKAAPTPSEYPFLDTYRQNSDNFKNKYAPKVVSEDADNLQKRRSGDYQEIILGEDRQGNYWLFNDGSTTYLIPSPKLKVNDLNIRTAGGLFTCENYTPGYQHINIVRPAIVSTQLGGNERWKLEQKGILEFI
jgi:hypothetical protein